jgi:hypothetical protein
MKELGLTDNPFGPQRLRGPDVRYLQTLDRLPLRVDICETVHPLFFCGFPLAATHFKEWKRQLSGLGFEPGEELPNAGIVAIIRGGRGTGKTTLAAKFLSYLRECHPESGPEWVDASQAFPDQDITRSLPTSADIQKVCDDLRDALAKCPKGGAVHALIDNVTEEILPKVMAEFQRASHCLRVFILTSDHLPLVDGDPDQYNFPIPIIDFKLDAVDEAAAIAYAQFRIDHFRVRSEPPVALCDPMFPLLEAAVRRWSARPSGGSGQDGSPLVVRVLNTMLSGKIARLREKFREEPFRSLPPPHNVTLRDLEAALNDL